MKESINNYTEENESIKNSEKSIFSQPEEWMDSFYELYEDGRKHHNAPQSYIDYFKARQFLLTEIRKAEERVVEEILNLKYTAVNKDAEYCISIETIKKYLEALKK